MSKRKFKFIDLADDDYIEEEIVNQKEANNISFVETEKIVEEKSPQVVQFQEEPKIEVIKKPEPIVEEPKIIPVEIIKNIPDSKPEILEIKKVIKKPKEITNNSIKIDAFFKEKEKLDVKTNIYLKKENYLKIEEIYKSTGNSRSSIINKLIEIALNKIGEN